MGAYKRALRENASQMADIQKQIAEAGQSKYNEASVTQQGQDYYNTAADNYAKLALSAEQGMTPEEMAQARNEYAGNQNLITQNAINAGGGGLGSYIKGITNSGNNSFSLGLAAENQNIKRQNRGLAMQGLQILGGATDQFQKAQDMNFDKQTLIQQSLGQAAQNNQANLNNLRQARMTNNAALIGAGIGIVGDVAGAAIKK